MTAGAQYADSCAFCKISATYPPDPSSPIPTSADPEAIFPQCHLILSTPSVLAFLDIMPMAPGHLLLTTRAHYEKLSDIPDTAPSPTNSTSSPASASTSPGGAAEQLGAWLPRLSRALCTVTGVRDWNVVQNNGAGAAQVVPHVHFHLIPRYAEGRQPEPLLPGKKGGKAGKVQDDMMKSWRMFGRGAREDLDDDEGREMAGRLREALKWDGKEAKL